jgi:ribose transport system ATP-binding protein
MAEQPVVADSQLPPRLKMGGVHKRFGGTVALDGVDLAVGAGQVLALVGENGAGKSTLMKVLSGAHVADRGQMFLDGEPFSPRNPLDARRAGVSMIYQELSLAPHLSAEENILLGMEPTRYGWLRRGEMRRSAMGALRQLGHEEIPAHVPVGELSIGAQQLVEVARAVAVGCRVLVLDEPTSSLSQEDVQRLFALVRRLKAQQLAIVYISHFIEEVQEVADRFTVLRDGKTVGGGQMSDTTAARIVQLMVGREIGNLYPRSKRATGDVILEVSDLAGLSKPRAASLSLRRGEVLGIAGLVGAGRTELLRAVFGLDAVRKGTVRLATHVGPYSPARRWAQGAGFVCEARQTEGLATALSIADNMTLSCLDGMGPAGLPGLIRPRLQHRATQRWIDELAIRCRDPRQRVMDLSGGNQQKVAIARLLHHDVDVLLLDEPTRGIDVGSKAQIYQLIDRLATGASGCGRQPRAVLMVSSYLPELLGVCDRIAVMHRGRLGPARPVSQLTEHKLMMEATGQESAA